MLIYTYIKNLCMKLKFSKTLVNYKIKKKKTYKF